MKINTNTPRSNFGFQVCSPYPFRLARFGEGDGTLKIGCEASTPAPPESKLLSEWKLQGSDHDITAKLYSVGQSYRYFISDAGWFEIDPAGRSIAIPEAGDEIIRELRFWGLPTLLCSMYRGDFFLHAAAVEVNGGAVLLAAPGRYGKTTLAMAFHLEGYRVLSEDTACCRLAASPVLLPGPALLRMRPDMFDGSAPAGTHVVESYDDRIFLAFDSDRRGNDDPVPIKAIVLLRESANEIHLDRVPAQKSLPDLWALGFRLPTDAARARSFVQLSGLVSNISIWNLYRPLRVSDLRKTVAKIIRSLPSPS
jgi:hypothetical protein